MSFITTHLPLPTHIPPYQSLTYLFFTLFSISFLVFLNASISFVITDRLHIVHNVGDIVGTLGFVDELVAIVTAPIWGVLSDGRIGTRGVVVMGYILVATGLVLTVLVESVYPGLVIARIIFASGAIAVATMVSAVLMELTETLSENEVDKSGKLAGVVGLCTGFGALLALAVFLPLPKAFGSGDGVEDKGPAVQKAYFTVATIAVLVGYLCYVGLPPPAEGDGVWTAMRKMIRRWKKWTWIHVWGGNPHALGDDTPEEATEDLRCTRGGLKDAILLGFKDSRITVAYVGGFVARASSVGVSLFIPLLVNRYFIDRGVCPPDADTGIPKRDCWRGYTVAAELTGTSQFLALITAPLFGYLSSSSCLHPIAPILIAALLGIISWTLLPFFPPDPKIAPIIFLPITLIGISQIGAIVASLGLLGTAVNSQSYSASVETETEPLIRGENAGLVRNRRRNGRGAVAGVYSFCGGLGILVLTKAGGWAFENLGRGWPFWGLAAANGVWMLVGSGAVVAGWIRRGNV
ncbi:hypothetical protein RUND412_009298 [Rhizina undulata]